jgi:glutamate-1-semialdehyde aminotransferase
MRAISFRFRRTKPTTRSRRFGNPTTMITIGSSDLCFERARRPIPGGVLRPARSFRIKHAEELRVPAVLEQRTGAFYTERRRRFQRAGLPIDVTSFSSLFWVHGATGFPFRRIDQIPGVRPRLFSQLFTAALSGGVDLSPSPYEVNFLSFAHTDGVLNRAADVLEKAAAGLDAEA